MPAVLFCDARILTHQVVHILFLVYTHEEISIPHSSSRAARPAPSLVSELEERFSSRSVLKVMLMVRKIKG